MTETTWDNPDLYRRLSQPYSDEAASSAALEKFVAGVAKLREECGIANVAVIASVFVTVEGRKGAHDASISLGNHHQCEGMVQRQFHGWLANWMDDNRDILDLIGFKGGRE